MQVNQRRKAGFNHFIAHAEWEFETRNSRCALKLARYEPPKASVRKAAAIRYGQQNRNYGRGVLTRDDA